MRKLSLLMASLVLSATAAAADLPENIIDGTMGEIRIQGRLLSSTCAMRMETPVQNVDLGEISGKGMDKLGARSADVPFKLNFSGCLVGAYADEAAAQRIQVLETEAQGVNTDQFLNGQRGVVLTFVGEPDLKDQRLLKVHGDIEGVGIRLTDAQGQHLNINTPNKAYVLTPGENSLKFYAALQTTQKNIRAGDFSSVVNVRLSYL